MCMRKRRLLVLLGAGASVEQKIPGVDDLNKAMLQWADAWGRAGTARHPQPDVYRHVWEKLGQYYARAPKPALSPKPNFERALADMLSLEAWLREPPYGTTWREALGWPGANGALPPATTDASVRHQTTTLMVHLAEHMRAAARGVLTTTPSMIAYRAFFTALEAEFELGIFSLNYDDLIVQALPQLRTGFDHAGRFEPMSVHAPSAWGFVYHLHGSVHYTLKTTAGIPKHIRWVDDLTHSDEFYDGGVGLSGNEGEGDIHLPRTTLIAGGHKLSQLMYEPHKSYYAALIRSMYEADAVLIAGYGFADEHVNRALEGRFAMANPKPPAVVLDYRDVSADWLEADHAGPWTAPMARSLAVESHFGPEGHRSPWSVGELRAQWLFEADERERVWVWHHGFLSASKRLEMIINVLRR